MAAISPGSPPATIVRLHLPQLDLAVFRYLIPHLLPRGAIRLQQGYLKKAKQTAVETFRMNMACKSQNWVIGKEMDCLRVTQNLVKEHITDSSQCSIILTEIEKLIDEYAKRKLHLANASSTSTFNWKQQQKQRTKKRKNEEELVREAAETRANSLD
ncbi:hypothetical protein EJB05_05817 [Eragrostis curvula]|uniref:Uncharacterized protein n=1 Tax=Eragrostis curvula TaxID=38414 RepID=A0A5J9WE34_9POAL|nr:hypothetical protein EJB05_05817 [Eragrostis curvula]